MTGHTMVLYLAGVVLSLLRTLAAQNDTWTPDTVPLDTRQLWCRANIQTCTAVCYPLNATVNLCNATDLSYNCQCNGFTPSLSNYYSTIPYFICNDQYVDCISNHPNDAAGQQTCIDSQQKFCSSYRNASDPSASAVQTLTSTATIVSTLPDGELSTTQIAVSFIQPEGVSIGQTSASRTASSSQTSASTNSSPQPSNTSNADSLASTNSGLSAGEISAAVIVPVLAVLGIIAAVTIFVRRRKRKSSSSDSKDVEPWERKELHGKDVPRKELPSSTRWELSTDRIDHRNELEGDLTRERSEMAANEVAAVETATGDADRTK